MNNRSEIFVENVMNDPGKIYKIPGLVLIDDRLTLEEKEKILYSWEQDQLALIRAEDENMIQKDSKASAIDLLEKVKKAEKVLAAAASSIPKNPAA